MVLFRQGKLKQPRKILEAVVSQYPSHVPSRIALAEVAIGERDFARAIKEGRQTTSLAMIQCKERGISKGSLGEHYEGGLVLRSLYVTARAYLLAGDPAEAINTFAAILQEDPNDSVGACSELIEIFFEQRRPHGVLGLFRLRFTHGLNLLDVVLAALSMGDLRTSLQALIDALETVPETRAALSGLRAADEIEEGFLLAYLDHRKPRWEGYTETVSAMLTHPVIARTMELVDELDEEDNWDPNVELREVRCTLFQTLREAGILERIVGSLKI